MAGVTQRLGVFGGTFDPPHLGHLILAAEARYQLHLDRVLWVLTPDPPHKRGQAITPLALRLEMVQAAIADEPVFVLSRVEIDRPGPHYALDTVRLLKAQHPNATLVYLIGGDSLVELPTWYQATAFVAACDEIGVMRRPASTVDWDAALDALPGLRAKARFVDAPLLEIAARDIRQRVREGRPFRYFLPSAVYQLIRERRLYCDTS